MTARALEVAGYLIALTGVLAGAGAFGCWAYGRFFAYDEPDVARYESEVARSDRREACLETRSSFRSGRGASGLASVHVLRPHAPDVRHPRSPTS